MHRFVARRTAKSIVARKYCSHQNDGMPRGITVNHAEVFPSIPHCTALFLLSSIKLTSDGSGIGFQFLDLIPGVASKDGPCD